MDKNKENSVSCRYSGFYECEGEACYYGETFKRYICLCNTCYYCYVKIHCFDFRKISKEEYIMQEALK